MPEVSASQWERFLQPHSEVHLLQTCAWGELKSSFGWNVVRLIVDDAKPNRLSQSIGAQILFRRLPLGLTLAYIPKGPVGGDFSTLGWTAWEALWPEVDIVCRKYNAFFLKVEPDLWELESSLPGSHKHNLLGGFQPGRQDIQPRRTLVVDLSVDENQILARMKQKTRYNIRLALRKGVVVSATSDIEAFYRLLQLTADRDNFALHELEYYRRAYELFHPRGECELLKAEYEGELIAALMVFAKERRAWYFYGASADQHRDRMPAYILQWEAMRWARTRDCVSYDLWGIPDYDKDTLEAEFLQHTEALWGVYRFKRGFGGELRRSIGSWDRIYRPATYLAYSLWLKSYAGFR